MQISYENSKLPESQKILRAASFYSPANLNDLRSIRNPQNNFRRK